MKITFDNNNNNNNNTVYHGDVAVGAFACTEDSNKQIRLRLIAVLPAFQNCGFGMLFFILMFCGIGQKWFDVVFFFCCCLFYKLCKDRN